MKDFCLESNVKSQKLERAPLIDLFGPTQTLSLINSSIIVEIQFVNLIFTFGNVEVCGMNRY